MTENEREMMQGYRDGRDDHRNELPAQTNYSVAYVHGWLNGRDDRLREPRASASELRQLLAEILSEEA